MEIGRRVFRESGSPSARSMVESVVLHVLVLALVMLLGASVLVRTAPRTKKEIDIVFYRPAAIPVPPVPPPPSRGTTAAEPKPKAPEAPNGPGKPELPPGPDKGFSADVKPPEPQRNVGSAGILKFKEQFASLAQAEVAPRLGSDARYGAADDVGQSSAHSVLTTNMPGSSGGIDPGSLSRNVGGGGGRGGGGGGGGIPGVQVVRATSSIAGIGGGGDRPKARGGLGPSRTDEEIQIVFDRYKSAFYRDYNRELRRNPTLQGKMVLRLTIEPDGAVSMCQLQSTDMDSPDLVAQVLTRVRAMNFGAKDGVQAMTIVYPIDFLPAT